MSSLFMHNVVSKVSAHDPHKSLIINCDQTPLKYVPYAESTMAPRNSSNVAIAGISDQRSNEWTLPPLAAYLWQKDTSKFAEIQVFVVVLLEAETPLTIPTKKKP